MLCPAKETINKIKTTYGMEENICKIFADDATNIQPIYKNQKL